jgi:hypothetical protein
MSNIAFDGVGANRAGHDDHQTIAANGTRSTAAKTGTVVAQHQADNIAEIHRCDEAPDEIFVLHKQRGPGLRPHTISPPSKMAAVPEPGILAPASAGARPCQGVPQSPARTHRPYAALTEAGSFSLGKM